MKYAFWILCIVMSAALLGCVKQQSVYKDWYAPEAISGDGTLTLTASWNPQLEKAEMSWQQAENLAAQRCRAHGYNGAQALGGSTQQCVQWSGGNCQQMRAEITFQCVGKPVRSRPAPRPNTPYSRVD